MQRPHENLLNIRRISADWHRVAGIRTKADPSSSLGCKVIVEATCVSAAPICNLYFSSGQQGMFHNNGCHMIFANGDVVLVSHRRMFERDEARYFVGRTIACEGPLVKVEGFTFVRDLSNGHIVKKQEKRIKVLSLASPGHIVYQLPGNTDVEAIDIEDGNGDAFVVDGSHRLMNLSERTHCGHF